MTTPNRDQQETTVENNDPPKKIEFDPRNDNNPKPPRPTESVARGFVLALAGYDIAQIPEEQRAACSEVARCWKARLYDVPSIRAATGIGSKKIRAAFDTLRFAALPGTITG